MEMMPRTAEARSFRTFLWIWFGQLVSGIGSGLSGFALGVHAYAQSHSATDFSLIVLCSLAPSIVFKPLGGVLADRFDRRLMMMLGDLGAGLGVAMIVLVMLAGDAPLWQICSGLAFSSLFMALQNPACKALVTDLVPASDYARVSGLVQLAFASQYLISPVIAAYLLSVADIRSVLLIDVASFGVAGLTVLSVMKKIPGHGASATPVSEGLVRSLAAGWAAVCAQRDVLILVIILSLLTFYVGLLQTLLGPMILSFADAAVLGTILSVSATGVLVCSALIGVFGKTLKPATLLVAGLLLAAVSLAGLGAVTRVWAMLAAGFLFFSSLPLINTGAEVLIRTRIDNHVQGRAWGIIGVLTQMGYLVAYGSAGPLADRVFSPLLMDGGALAARLGPWIGSGPGRGIGLLFIVAGASVLLLAGATVRARLARQ